MTLPLDGYVDLMANKGVSEAEVRVECQLDVGLCLRVVGGGHDAPRCLRSRSACMRALPT